MRNKKASALTVAVMCLLVAFGAAFSLNASAYNEKWDVGNYNDYGSYDSGYDYGGYDSYDSYDSHDSHDSYDSYDSYDSHDSYDSYDSNSKSRSYSYDDASELMSTSMIFSLIMNLVPIVFIFAIIFILKNVIKKSVSQQQNNRPAQPLRVAKPGNHQAQILLAVNKIDPQFSDIRFVSWAKENFILLQQAWTARDWSKIRPFEKEELFRQHELQLQEYINTHRINYIENINISDAYLHLYRRDNQYEYLTVYMSTRIIDYIVDERTGNVIKGSKDKYCYIDYLMTYMRKKGVKTDISTGTKANVCPHCGAPLDSISSAGQCNYCGCIVTSGEFNWVLAEMDALRPGLSINEQGVIISETDNYENMQNNNPNKPPENM